MMHLRAAQAGGRLAALAPMMAVVLAVSAGASASAVLAASSRTPAWVVMRGPMLSQNNALNSIVAISPLSAWAAGIEGFSSDGRLPGRPLLEHWNGRAWSTVRVPSSWPGGLRFVAASSARDAWALGQEPSGRREHLLHWNGSGWQNSPFPGTPGAFYGNLGLTAEPGGRAWLIATIDGASAQIFGRNGGSWRPQSYPCPVLRCNLDDISARAWNDAWAVGNYIQAGLAGLAGGPLALHWDGRNWQAIPVPYVQSGYLTGVFGASATNAWAVGAVFQAGTMLLYHWDGTSWHQLAVPSGLTRPALGEQTGITGDSAGHLWIYGIGTQGADRASYLRYDGRNWSTVSDAAVAGQSGVTVRAVARVPGTSAAWSVGAGFVARLDARARIELYGRVAAVSRSAVLRHASDQPAPRVGAVGWPATVRARPASDVIPVATPPAACPTVPGQPVGGSPKIMVVGDSISQGSSGDYTWRYRLYKHLVSDRLHPWMVGPYNWLANNVTGTQGDCSYADPVFENAHDAWWGRMLADEMMTIQGEVTQYQPDYLLVLLGINDLIFGRTDVAGTEANLKTFIANARAGNPNVKIVIGLLLPRVNDPSILAAQVAQYNAELPGIAVQMSTQSSPIAIANDASAIDPATDLWDGTHPNAEGEIKIAAGFADALSSNFGFGSAYTPVPVVPTGPRVAPRLTVTPGAEQAQLSWTLTPGATVYMVYMENVTAGQTTFSELPYGLTASDDPWTARPLVNSATYRFTLQACKGVNCGVFSNTSRAS